MCSLTFIPRAYGYLVGMNRDTEKSVSNPPTIHFQRVGSKTTIMYPKEGETHARIGINNKGITLCLLNNHSFTPKDQLELSLIIPAILECVSDYEISLRIQAFLNQKQLPPFKLIGIFLKETKLLEWFWNRRQLLIRPREWKPKLWACSLENELEIQSGRRKLFELALKEPDKGTPKWLRRFHRLHHVAVPSFSICMHDKYLVTTSYTQIIVAGSRIQLLHQNGPPCSKGLVVKQFMRLNLKEAFLEKQP